MYKEEWDEIRENLDNDLENEGVVSNWEEDNWDDGFIKGYQQALRNMEVTLERYYRWAKENGNNTGGIL